MCVFALLLLPRQRPSTCSDSTGVFAPDNLRSFLTELIDMSAVFGFLNPQLPHETVSDQLTAKRTCVHIPSSQYTALCESTLITAAEER